MEVKKTKIFEEDITKVNSNDLLVNKSNVDVVVGGPPCQGFSTLGKRSVKDRRNTLVDIFLKIINKCQWLWKMPMADQRLPLWDAKKSECGTWSHAAISSLGARARGGGGQAPMVQCRTLSDLIGHDRT